MVSSRYERFTMTCTGCDRSLPESSRDDASSDEAMVVVVTIVPHREGLVVLPFS